MREADVEIGWYRFWQIMRAVNDLATDEQCVFLFTPDGVKVLGNDLFLSLFRPAFGEYVCRKYCKLIMPIGKLWRFVKGTKDRKMKGTVRIYLREDEFIFERGGSTYTFDNIHLPTYAVASQKRAM